MYAALCAKCLLFLTDCTKHGDRPTELINNPKYGISPKFAVGMALFLAAVRTNGHDGTSTAVRTRLQTDCDGCVSFEVLTAVCQRIQVFCVCELVPSDVSNDPIVFVFKCQGERLKPWRWRHCDSSKRRVHLPSDRVSLSGIPNPPNEL